MPVWGWILLIAGLSGLAVAAVGLIVRTTHRLPAREPLLGDPTNFAAPVPLDLADRDELTERELDTEERRHTPVS